MKKLSKVVPSCSLSHFVNFPLIWICCGHHYSVLHLCWPPYCSQCLIVFILCHTLNETISCYKRNCNVLIYLGNCVKQTKAQIPKSVCVVAEIQGINIWMRYRARWFKPAWLYWFKTKNSSSSLLYMAPKLSLGTFRTSSPLLWYSPENQPSPDWNLKRCFCVFFHVTT